MTRPKRKYVLLSPSAWAELRAYWEAGDHTLAELSDRYGVSSRAIQSHLSKLGSIKGSKAAEMAAVVQKEIFKNELGDQDALVFRAKETREATYANAKIIEDLMMAQLHIAQKHPTQAFKAATAIKTLSLAASALERLHATKLRALGLDQKNALPNELPVLVFRDLNSTELEAFNKRDEEEDEFSGSIMPVANTDTESALSESGESDDIVEEGVELDEEEALEKPRSAAMDALGGRLVRGLLP